MTRDQIPEFIAAILATSCDITAVGDDFYVLGDSDLPPKKAKVAHAASAKFGERDHLRYDIIAYLKSIGRHIPLN